MNIFLLNTPMPTPTFEYPPTFNVAGSTLPLIWAAVVLVAIILTATLFFERKKPNDKTRPNR